MRDRLERMRDDSNTDKINSVANYNEESRKRLMKIIQTKLRTAFICPLSKFEQYFGELIGYKKSDNELSLTELKLRKLFESFRNDVLNNGNNQIRALEKELTEYTIKWNRHFVSLPVKPIKEKEDFSGNQ